MTTAVLDVLDVLANSPADDPAWGLRICDLTGHGSGTIYPVLERLERVGWIEGSWEAQAPEDRPRRRLYVLTSAGRVNYGQVLTARDKRRLSWRQPTEQAGAQ